MNSKVDVKLVSITEPVIEDVNTAEELIAFCARVSNPSNQLNHESADKLLKYCANNQHWSIFEMVNVVLEVNITRDIGRQVLRHRSFSFQEFSQRYAEVDESWFQLSEARLQDKKNRQNSIECNEKWLNDWWLLNQQRVLDHSVEVYKAALKHGIAKEVARKVLPEGLTMSRMYMNGTLRSWIHYCALRMGNGTQKEHIDIATKAWEVIVQQFPTFECLV